MKTALLVSLVSSLALAAPRPARDTADVGKQGDYSVGIFNPLRIAILDGVELEANPLVFFVAPNVNARFRVIGGPLRLTAEAVLNKSKSAALQALLVDPVVHSVSAAEQMLEMMLRVQRRWLGYLA